MKDAATRFRYPLNLQLFAEDGANPEGDAKAPKTFTQEEVDSIVRDRLARDRRGREDYDDIKARLEDIEGKYTAILTEKEAAEKRALEAEEAQGKVMETANQRMIKAEFKTLALLGERRVRPDAVEDAFRLTDLSEIRFDEDGNIVGLKEAVESLLESKPYLIVEQPAGSRQIGGDTNNGDRKAPLETMTTAQLISQGLKRK